MHSHWSALALVVAAAACSDRSATAPVAPSPATSSISLDRNADRDESVGGVFAETNDATANAVVAFARHADGTLTYVANYPTNGQGIYGAVDPLQSQYAVVLTPDHRYLFAVNAGSNSVAAFEVSGHGLRAIGTVASNGVTPVSLAATDRVLYVLNKGSNTVTGFRIDGGRLKAEARWTRALSTGATGAAAIRFDHGEQLLAVTERLSNTIDVFTVHRDGRLSAEPVTTATAGTVPFGFDWAAHRQLIASEAGSGAASYVANRRGELAVTSGSPISTQQTAPCWLITTHDGRFAYVANAGSSSITGFEIAPNGVLSLIAPATGTLAAGSTPLDLDVSRDSKYLYVLKAGSNSIGAFRVNVDGTLTALADGTGGLASRSGQMGLAAF
jgi:6-phosphogluconolactonase (cycloisomerase 2 family)